MKIIWFEALVIAIGVFIYNFYIRPRRLHRNAYYVKDVIQESINTWTLRLKSKDKKSFQYLPGQFIFLTLYQDGLPPEEHPFSISSAPTTDGLISVTIKESGDYTRNIRYIKEGAKATVDGPYGRFSCLLHDDIELVLIAGGVGITPIMSMLRYLRDIEYNGPIILIYSCKNNDIIFQRELEEMGSFIKVVFIASQPAYSWKGETGRLNQEKIVKYIGMDMDKKGFYICGPISMMKTVVSILSGLGVPDKRIYFEIFTL